MSDIKYIESGRDGWWSALDLSYDGIPVTGRHELEAERAALAVLAAHPPIAFAADAEGRMLTAAQLRERMERAVEGAAQEAERRREAGAEERRRFGWARVEEALSAPDADEVVAEGRWAGLARGEAIAWCWNLFQYEPCGLVHPGSQLRHEAMQTLRAGGLPEVFGYPERAREHIARGLTPREYRRYKEALGAVTFSSLDVRRG